MIMYITRFDYDGISKLYQIIDNKLLIKKSTTSPQYELLTYDRHIYSFTDKFGMNETRSFRWNIENNGLSVNESDKPRWFRIC